METSDPVPVSPEPIPVHAPDPMDEAILDAVLPGEREDAIQDALPADSPWAEGSRPLLPADSQSLALPRPPHPGWWWSLVWCLAFVMVTQAIGAGVAVVILFALLFGQPGRYDLAHMTQDALMKSDAYSVAMAAAMAVTEIAVIAFALVAIRVVVGKGWTRQLALRRPSVCHVLIALAALPGLMAVSNLFYALVSLFLPDLKDFGLPSMEEMVEVFSSWPWQFSVLVIGLGPGIGEELFCRGFLGRGLVGRHGYAIGAAMTSFLFGFIHLIPRQAAAAALMGLALHYTYLTTRSIFVPMLLHFLNNSLAVTLEKIAHLDSVTALNDKLSQVELLDKLSRVELLKGAWGIAALAVSACLLLLVAGWALYRSRPRLLSAEGWVHYLIAPREVLTASPTTQPTWFWQPDFPGVAYPPPESGSTVVRPWPGWLASGLVLLAFGNCVTVMLLAN